MRDGNFVENKKNMTARQLLWLGNVIYLIHEFM